MALVLPLHENVVKDKHVESLWFPCLDEGSTPSSSTVSIDMLSKIKNKSSSTPLPVKVGEFFYFFYFLAL